MATDTDGEGFGEIRLRPRRVGGDKPGEDHANARFLWGTLLFVLVAAAYPWYSYWVHSHLVERDARRALASFGRDFRAMETQVAEALDESPMQTARPLPSPRILGVSEGTTTSVIVADLDGVSLDDAQSRLCAEASRWTQRTVAGRTFRVQRYLGRSPAVTIGVIRC